MVISSQKPTVLGQKSSFPLKNRRFLDKKVDFLSKTNGSWTKKLISSQKPTVLGQKSSFPLKNQRFWHKKVHFLSKTDGSGTKKSISSQKPTVLGQKREKRWGFSAFWEGGECFLQKISNITVSWKNLSLKKKGIRFLSFFLLQKIEFRDWRAVKVGKIWQDYIIMYSSMRFASPAEIIPRSSSFGSPFSVMKSTPSFSPFLLLWVKRSFTSKIVVLLEMKR